MRKHIYILGLILLVSCSKSNKDYVKFNDSIDAYIKEHPIAPISIVGDSIRIDDERQIAYPSYRVFFYKKEGENKMVVKLIPHYTKTNINVLSDSLQFNSQNAIGAFLYKKYPIIVFDSYNISSKYISSKLNSEIPDSLKLKEKYFNLRSKSKIYNLSE